MERIITKQMYKVVNVCTKARIFSLATILEKNNRRGF